MYRSSGQGTELPASAQVAFAQAMKGLTGADPYAAIPIYRGYDSAIVEFSSASTHYLMEGSVIQPGLEYS